MGRLLKYEITAPLDFIRIKWRPHHLQGRHPPRRSRHLRGAITVPLSCARQLPTFKDNLPHQVAFQQKRCFSLISLMRTGQRATSRLTARASHRARHNAGGVFPHYPHVSFSFLHSLPIDRAPARANSITIFLTTHGTHDARTGRQRTTRLGVHVGKTSRRRPAQAQRAAVTDSQERTPSVATNPIALNRLIIGCFPGL